MRRSRRIRSAAGWAASAAILVACGLTLRGRMTMIDVGSGRPGIVSVSGAVTANAAANSLIVVAWRGVLHAAGAGISARAAAWVWSVSQLARYTVGAAQVGGRAVVGRRYGLSATAGAATTLVEVAWQVAITATLVLATAPWWLPGASGLAWFAWIGALPAVVLAAGLAQPELLLRTTAAVLGWGPMKRFAGWRVAEVLDRVRLRRVDAARITVLYALNSGLRLAAFLTLFVAVGGSLPASGLRAVGAYALGQLVGRLAVFVPGGLGPREGATALIVAPAIGGGPALVLVASVRLAELLGETLFAGLACLVRPQPDSVD
jgi:glycosyltransferase 2 family protein